LSRRELQRARQSWSRPGEEPVGAQPEIRRRGKPPACLTPETPRTSTSREAAHYSFN